MRHQLSLAFSSAFLIAVLLFCGETTHAAPALSTDGQKGITLHVSQLGDNSDGLSWAKAFHTIQAALNAVPDDQGGHRVVIRPDTYIEANLYPAHKGAANAYNQLIGDTDGRLGSGATGWVVIDSGDPAKGFKSYDWWGTFRSTQKGWSKKHTDPTFSAITWDRWIFQHLYATGADAGLFWDCTDHVEPFTVVVENCVGIGRAFGGGVANCLSRPDEPITFKRSKLWCLDWWGDAAGAYVRIENKTMPDRPDVIFEDCTLVGPDNALKSGNPGFETYTHARLKNCRLISLNFSQPHGTPSTGVIHSTMDGKTFHVDLEDCTLMGYKVFGAGKANAGKKVSPIGYTTKGDVKAYVQFQQSVPKGFVRLGHWPVDVFQTMLPPSPTNTRPALVKEDLVLNDNLCEFAAIVWKGKLCLMECIRPAQGGSAEDYYLLLKDVETGKQMARFAEGYGLASAMVHENTLYVSASRFADANWNDVTLFQSSDLQNWQSKIIIQQKKSEHLFNSSLCADGNGFALAYETNDPSFPAFSVKFARSDDLKNWTKLPGVVFGKDRYTACPCIRYTNGYYYLTWLERRSPRWFFETWLGRSKDLSTWQLSQANPLIAPGPNESINTSDSDIIEYDGKTYVYYAVGDQRTWMKLKRAVYPAPLGQFFEAWFADQKD